MAFRTSDEDEYTRRVINCEWSFEVNQERIFYLLAKIVFSLHLTTVMFVIEVADSQLVTSLKCWSLLKITRC